MSETSTSIHPAIGELLRQVELGEPAIHHGIGLWPLVIEPRPEPVYVALVEALPLDGFKITEISEGGSVPNLRVINETPHHVLLFDGEELKGAKQNRILNTTILVPRGSSLDVPVSCTESGRWSYDSPEFGSSGRMAHAQLRKLKSKSVSESLEVRACHASDQGGVWEEIEALHQQADSGDKSSTRAMEDAFNERRQDLDEFARGVLCRDGQCGLLAVIGDRVEGMDLLSRPGAYERLHRRLVESHAMDFLVRKRGETRRPADPEAPARFLAEAAKAEESVHDSPGPGSDHRLRFRWGHGSALRVEETIVHLALFGGSGLGKGHHPSEPPLHRFRRRYRP